MTFNKVIIVAPPRGERGLKSLGVVSCGGITLGRSPSWGAWIEICLLQVPFELYRVAPPRGERGLKFLTSDAALSIEGVAPPRGERGLKY